MTTTTRKTFTVLTKKTVLIDLNGKPMKCSFHGCTCEATHIHHSKYVSEGGTNAVENLQPMCSFHHIHLHSVRGDFRAWGSLGGQRTHATININALKNLPQFRGEQGAVRLAAYITKKTQEVNA